jgi:DNA-binding MarR family transcriptional regulator
MALKFYLVTPAGQALLDKIREAEALVDRHYQAELGSEPKAILRQIE